MFLMNLTDWYNKGLTSDEYKQTLTDHKEAFLHISSAFNCSNEPELKEIVTARDLRVLVLAEPWCGHCLLNIPILLNLAETINLPVRFLLRDDNLPLMDAYLTNGKSRTIPIFIFINEDGEEIGKWGPIAETTKQFVDTHRKDLPAEDADNFEEERNKFFRFISNRFAEEPNLWQGAYESIKKEISQL